VLRELFAIRDLNLRVAEIGAITSSQMDLVVRRIDEAMGATSVGEDGTEWRVDDKEAVKRVADEMYRQARTFVGAGFPTYCRLKVEAAGRRLADEVAERFVYPYDSSRSSFVRAAIAAWARGQDEWRQPDPEQLLRLLGPVDVPYRERRLLFILAGVNVFYGRLDQGDDGPPREDLDALKTAAWDLLEQLRRIPGEVVRDVRAEDVAFLAPGSVDAARFGSPDAFATKHDSRLPCTVHLLPR
jgi:hypothetical protein